MEENKKIEFEINKLVVSIYNKIAIWNNSDFGSPERKGDALKIVSQDIVQTALEEISSEFGFNTSTSVFRGDTKVGDIDAMKDDESFSESNEQDILNKLFDK